MKWEVKKMHANCKDCSQCAANAIQHAENTDASVAESAYLDGVEDGSTVLHHARVELR